LDRSNALGVVDEGADANSAAPPDCALVGRVYDRHLRPRHFGVKEGQVGRAGRQGNHGQENKPKAFKSPNCGLDIGQQLIGCSPPFFYAFHLFKLPAFGRFELHGSDVLSR
jgi:hypothetical protein